MVDLGDVYLNDLMAKALLHGTNTAEKYMCDLQDAAYDEGEVDDDDSEAQWGNSGPNSIDLDSNSVGSVDSILGEGSGKVTIEEKPGPSRNPGHQRSSRIKRTPARDAGMVATTAATTTAVTTSTKTRSRRVKKEREVDTEPSQNGPSRIDGKWQQWILMYGPPRLSRQHYAP
jgi:hypothetical protein